MSISLENNKDFMNEMELNKDIYKSKKINKFRFQNYLFKSKKEKNLDSENYTSALQRIKEYEPIEFESGLCLILKERPQIKEVLRREMMDLIVMKDGKHITIEEIIPNFERIHEVELNEFGMYYNLKLDLIEDIFNAFIKTSYLEFNYDSSLLKYLLDGETVSLPCFMFIKNTLDEYRKQSKEKNEKSDNLVKKIDYHQYKVEMKLFIKNLHLNPYIQLANQSSSIVGNYKRKYPGQNVSKQIKFVKKWYAENNIEVNKNQIMKELEMLNE